MMKAMISIHKEPALMEGSTLSRSTPCSCPNLPHSTSQSKFKSFGHCKHNLHKYNKISS